MMSNRTLTCIMLATSESLRRALGWSLLLMLFVFCRSSQGQLSIDVAGSGSGWLWGGWSLTWDAHNGWQANGSRECALDFEHTIDELEHTQGL
jgi:hypothetical protein